MTVDEFISKKTFHALVALSNQTRLAILYEIREHCAHCTIHELMSRFSMSRNAIKYHLQYLLNSGLLAYELLPMKDKREFRRHQYTYLITDYANHWLELLGNMDVRFEEQHVPMKEQI